METPLAFSGPSSSFMSRIDDRCHSGRRALVSVWNDRAKVREFLRGVRIRQRLVQRINECPLNVGWQILWCQNAIPS